MKLDLDLDIDGLTELYHRNMEEVQYFSDMYTLNYDLNCILEDIWNLKTVRLPADPDTGTITIKIIGTIIWVNKDPEQATIIEYIAENKEESDKIFEKFNNFAVNMYQLKTFYNLYLSEIER